VKKFKETKEILVLKVDFLTHRLYGSYIMYYFDPVCMCKDRIVTNFIKIASERT